MQSPELPSSPTNAFTGLWMESLAPAPKPAWLWEGLLAPGCLTLFTSQWKTGKTTLVSVLLSKMQTGQSLAGLRIEQGRGLVITEEPQMLWLQRIHKLGLSKHLVIHRPFDALPSREQWLALLDHVRQLHGQHRFRLLVIDPLALFFPGYTESDAAAATRCLAELRRVADLGLSVLVLHHPKKGETREGQAARGSGALGAQVDIVLEMTCFSSMSLPDRRRRISAYSRFEETPRRLLLELNADGTDYNVLPPQAACEQDLILLDLLRQANAPLSAANLRALWPTDHTRPDITTMRRWLSHLVEQGLLAQEGTGRKNDAFRYALAKQPR